MSNHFHIMIYVKKIKAEESADPGNNLTESDAKRLTLSKSGNLYIHCSKDHTLNYSIGMMLSSYSQTINKQLKRSGSLFRNNTKSECVTEYNGISPSFINTSKSTLLNLHPVAKEYPKLCFDYILYNPVRAGLVKNPEEWEFSSFRDVYGLRDGKLINRERIDEFGLK